MSAHRSFVVTRRMRSRVGLLTTAMLLAVVPASGVERAGSEFLVHTYEPANQSLNSIAANDGGSFVVVWTSSDQEDAGSPSSAGVFGQRFLSDGSPLGSEFQVNTYTIGFQGGPDVAVDADSASSCGAASTGSRSRTTATISGTN